MSEKFAHRSGANTYYDESLELTEDEDDDENDGRGRLSRETSLQPPRGDTPPSGNMSDSEDEYDQGDDDDDEQVTITHHFDAHFIGKSGMHNISTMPRTGANAVNPGRTSNGNGEKSGASQLQSTMAGSQAQRSSVRTVSKGADGDALATSTGDRPKLAKGLGLEDDDLREHLGADGDVSGLTSMRFPSKTSYGSGFKDFTISEEMKELFQYINRYKPQEIDLEPMLKPFIPDYIPAIGDIDAFIKIPRPDQKPDTLGLTVLDEPAGKQSDPTVLDLHLRAVSKSIAPVPQVVRSLDSVSLRTNPKPLENWIRNVKELHTAKPPPSVHYSRRMPDIEELMQAWPPEMEELLKTAELPSPELDMPLAQYVRLVSAILDIPAPSTTQSQNAGAKDGKKRSPTSNIEALHVLFTLYLKPRSGKRRGKYTLWKRLPKHSTAFLTFQEPNKKPKKPAEPKKKPNTSVYVSNLPRDVTFDEIKEAFEKFGILMEDLATGKPKIKLYTDNEGKFKGDALVTYFKEESVPLAINLLDDSPLRFGDSANIRVQEAVFKEKAPMTAEERRAQKPDKRLVQKKLQKLERRLDWVEGEENVLPDKFKKIVILKNMFTKEEIEMTASRIVAYHFDGKEKFKRKVSKEEEQAEEEKRLEAFEDWLEKEAK
ncbi:Intraflagellar transport protein 46 [Phlyctochytrium bullatum]|nr:Intraflagellar transport protein 46 [Phlyctochytrium bullatum]